MSGPRLGRWAPGRSAVGRWRHLLARGSSPRARQGQGPRFGGGAALQYRSILKPAIHAGFVFCFCSDKSYVSSLQTIWKKYECKKRRAITHRDTCQIRLETSVCLPQDLVLTRVNECEGLCLQFALPCLSARPSLVAQMAKGPPALREARAPSLGGGDPLEEESRPTPVSLASLVA